ncbi:MAG: DUF6763 family protein [Steroidobacteraceae bacterium]|jgi:hypothetical protein
MTDEAIVRATARGRLPDRSGRPKLDPARCIRIQTIRGLHTVAREYEPVVGQWYENIDENESFRVLSVDEDSELIEIEYLDGELEELDLDSWQELDLEKIEQPEGWSSNDKAEEEEEEDDELDEGWGEDEDEEDEDEDEDWDEDEEGRAGLRRPN